MNKNNLPIKIILQKTEDIFSNRGGGTPKFFGEVTPQLQAEISNKFESLLKFYNDVFEENENILLSAKSQSNRRQLPSHTNRMIYVEIALL